MKTKYILLTGLLAVTLLSACTAEVDLQSPSWENTDGPITVELFNEISQVAVTRVNDEGFCDGDAVGIYVVNYENGAPGQLLVEGNQGDNVRYTYDEANMKWVPESPVYFKDKKTPVDIYGYYPYGVPESVKAYSFEVQKDQSTEAANGQLGGYEASDFLWGKAENIAPTSSRIPVKFQHRMAGVLVTLIEGTGFEAGEYAGLDKAVLVTNTVRTATIDLSTGEVTPTGDVPATGTVPYSRNGEFRAVVVPQSVAASTPLFSITVGGTPYVFRKDEAFTYNVGKLHKFTIEISKKSQSGLEFKLIGESITAWEADNISHDGEAREYIVIDCTEPGTLKECITAADKDYTRIKNLKVTGTVNAYDFFFMRDEMTALQSINMQTVKIVATTTDYTDYAANEIPNMAFYEKTSLVRFVFPENIIRIGEYSFYRTNLSGSLVIPNEVEEIGSGAFCECPFGGTLTLPKALIKIGAEGFNNCGFQGTLNLPESLNYIGGSAFRNCGGFTGQLFLPKNLNHLGSSAFYLCKGFSGSLEIPPKISQIEAYTFAYCSGLNGTLTIPDNIKIIGDGAFYQCLFRGSLNLPKNLTVIGESAFLSNQFSGTLVLPSSLTSLGPWAFSGNSRLTGILEIPEDIITIPEQAFGDCSQLQGVVLSKNTEFIAESAFQNCYQLNSIVCNAINPPQLAESAFNGVAKDNFTVEVPEASVASYSVAPGWKEFRRISAHHDFSISRNLFRTLNASDSKTLVLRAPSGEAWSVESAPEWVSVEPSSGIGKVEVTMTVDALAEGSGYREGEVVFLLDGKDYRTRTKVEQYDYQYGDGDVLTHQTASVGDGVDIVFMGDCFDAKDIAEGHYLNAMNEAVEHYFAVEPYKTYRDYFNVYTVFGLSPDSGVGDVSTIREAKFGSAYALGGITPDETVCFEYACKAPTVSEADISRTLVVLIENTSDYGGITYMWGDGSAIACCPMSTDVYPYDFRGLIQHEAGGHGFGKLGDEYIYHNEFIQTCICICCPHVDEFNANKARGWYENLSLSGDRYEVPWSHLIFDPQYSNLVDIYEGGYMHMRGVFRSEPNSCMNNNVPYFSAISREAIVKRILEYAGEPYSFEDFKARDVQDASAVGMTKSPVPDFVVYPVSNKQHSPVYMGEKPEIR